MRFSLQLNQSLLQDWQTAMLKKRWWEIIKDLEENKLPGISRLWPLVWAFVPRFSAAAVSHTCSGELMPPLFILFFLPEIWLHWTAYLLMSTFWHIITSYPSRQTVKFISSHCCLVLWAVMVHGTLHSRVLFHLSSAVLLENMCVPKDWHQWCLTHWKIT